MWSVARGAEFCLAMARGVRCGLRAAKRDAAANQGFTLIEVVVAIAVLAIVLGAIGGAVGTVVKGVRSVDRQLPLLETAQSLLAGLPERNALRPGVQNGTTGAVHWRIDVAPLNAAVDGAAAGGGALSAKWMPLLVTVSVQGRDGPPVRLDTVRLVPRPAS